MKIYKFVEDKFPIQPFTFRFFFCDMKELGIEVQTLTNKKTGEGLLAQQYQHLPTWTKSGIEINQRLKPKKQTENQNWNAKKLFKCFVLN